MAQNRLWKFYMFQAMQTIKLNKGVEIPLLGLNVYLMNDPRDCERSVLTAINAGYHLTDTASACGNEEAVVHAIRKSSVARKRCL
jgi:diketogulonate reductase-like aldo/keto reductase